MRIMLAVLGAWAGLAVLAGGLFVALIRGGGGTDAAPLPAETPDVAMPAQREPDAPVALALEAALPEQRAGVEPVVGKPLRTRTRP